MLLMLDVLLETWFATHFLQHASSMLNMPESPEERVQAESDPVKTTLWKYAAKLRELVQAVWKYVISLLFQESKEHLVAVRAVAGKVPYDESTRAHCSKYVC